MNFSNFCHLKISKKWVWHKGGNSNPIGTNNTCYQKILKFKFDMKIYHRWGDYSFIKFYNRAIFLWLCHLFDFHFTVYPFISGRCASDKLIWFLSFYYLSTSRLFFTSEHALAFFKKHEIVCQFSCKLKWKRSINLRGKICEGLLSRLDEWYVGSFQPNNRAQILQVRLIRSFA